MTSVEEKAIEIFSSVSDDFNSLPYDERKKIGKYISKMQILTIWQMLIKNSHLTTEAWRKETREWLKNCVESHLKEYGND